MDKPREAGGPAAIALDGQNWTTTTPVRKSRPPVNYGGTERGAERQDVSLSVGVDVNGTELSLEELLELKRFDCKEIIHLIQTRFGTMKDLCERLGTNPDEGLNELNLEDFKRRRDKFGSNVIPTQATKSFFLFLWEAAQDTTLIILTVAAILSFGLSFYHPHHSPSEQGLPATVTGSTNTSIEVDDDGETEAEKSERKAGWIEAIGILLAVVIVVLVTAFVNWSKDIQFRGLQDRLACQHSACVVRSGKRLKIPVEELVVGDICVLNYGDVIPADGLLLLENDLRVDESSHTGESEEVTKCLTTDPVLFSGTHVKEGSGKMLVTAVGMHSAKGIILSLMGVSFNDENNPEEKRSLLHKKLVRIALVITYAGTVIAVLTFLILVTRFCVETFAVRHLPWDNAYIHQFVRFLIISITLLAVAVPEGLPLAVILALAYSVKKMMADNNLVRHLDACETMGSATTICCDKTGTLTANRMTVVQSYIAGSIFSKSDDLGSLPLELRIDLSTALAVNTNYSSQLGSQSSSGYGVACAGSTIGSKTECALLGFIESLGQDYRDIRRIYPDHQHVHIYPFSSDRKWMGTVIRFRAPGQPIIDGKTGRTFQREESGPNIVHRLLVKGAAEIILERCQWFVGEKGKIQSLVADESRRREIIDIINTMTNQGLRTLCIAYKDFTNSGSRMPHEQMMTSELDWKSESLVAQQLVCLAIVGIEDPVRPEVEEAVHQCQKAGIVVRMITGDNLQTAKFVAYKSGIICPEDHDSLLSIDGPTFNRMIRSNPDGPVEQDLIDRVWPRLRVLARSTPQDKYNLVKGIMDSKISEDQEVVAVTGDGTNDGPALKKAHVGFAMGISGTDVAKEASDIILVDDNFASIIKAVVWGRHVYDSITKFIQFQLTVNIVAVVMALVGACVVTDSPLKGAQMLWVNLLMDTLASLSLATERPSEEVLNRRPYGCSRPLVSHRMLLNIFGHAFYELLVLLSLLFGGAYLLGVEDGRSEWLKGLPSTHYTVIFNAFVMMILFNEICARKLDNSLNFFSGLERGPLFVAIWLASFAAQIAIIHWGGAVFSTTRLTLSQWAWCLLFGIGDLLYGFLLSLTVRICLSIHRLKLRTSSDSYFSESTFDKSPTPYELLAIDSSAKLR